MKVTPREQQVIDGLAEGLSNKEIADRLQISVRTVKQHIRVLCLRAGIEGGEGRGQKRIRLLNYLLPAAQLSERVAARLSPTERAVARHLLDGKSNREIAIACRLSGEGVVKRYVRRIFDKTGASTRMEFRSMLAREASEVAG